MNNEWVNKLDDKGKDEFVETYNVPRLNQKEIEYLNTPIIRKDIKTFIRHL